jgi:hypothetical protein
MPATQKGVCMLLIERIMNIFAPKKPRWAFNMKRAARWGLVAHSLVKTKRPASFGNRCCDCKWYMGIPNEQRGVCRFFKRPNVILWKSKDCKMDCIQVESKIVFCAFRTRLSGKGFNHGHNNEKSRKKKENKNGNAPKEGPSKENCTAA